MTVTIDRQTKIRLGLVLTAAGALVTFTVWINARTQDRYTLTMACEQALRMAIANPGIRVPDPRDQSKIIVVDTTKE